MWHALLHLKTTREQQAQSALTLRRAEQAAAHQRCQAAVERLQQHRHLAARQEHTLYANLLQQTVRLRDIEAVQQALAAMKIRDHQLDSDRDQASAFHAEAERHTAAALQRQRGAGRAKEKFTQLAALHLGAAIRTAQRAEDLEQEDGASLHRPAPAWDSE